MRVGRNILIYLGTSVASGLLPLLLLPFLTRQLDPSEYGIMITISSLISLIMPIINWGLIPYVGVQYFRSDPDNFPSIISTIFLVPFVMTLLLLLMFWVFGEWVAVWLKIPRAWVNAAPLLSVAFFLPLLVQNLLRMRDQPFGYAAMELSGAAINFSLTLILVFALDLGWEGRILAALTANIGLSLIAFIWLLRRKILTLTFVREQLGPALRFGSGTVLHDLANQLMRLSDRLLIVFMIGQFAAGQYAVAVQIASIMLVILSAFNRAWTPFVFSTLMDGSDLAREKLVLRSYLVQIILLALFAAFNLAMPLVYEILVDEQYHESIEYVFWLSLGYLFNGFYLTIVDHIFFVKKTHLLAGVTGFNAIATVGLAYFLVTHLGPVGAPMAFAITACLTMCAVFLIVQRISPLPWIRTLQR